MLFCLIAAAIVQYIWVHCANDEQWPAVQGPTTDAHKLSVDGLRLCDTIAVVKHRLGATATYQTRHTANVTTIIAVCRAGITTTTAYLQKARPIEEYAVTCVSGNELRLDETVVARADSPMDEVLTAFEQFGSPHRMGYDGGDLGYPLTGGWLYYADPGSNRVPLLSLKSLQHIGW